VYHDYGGKVDMGFLGDPGMDSYSFPICRQDFMPTALVRTYTTGGFVIAADGRMRSDRTWAIVSDTTQKIFEVGDQRRMLAYAFVGAAKLTPDDSDEVVFDFISETAKVVRVLATRKTKNLFGYAVRLSRAIQALLMDAKDVRFPVEGKQQPNETGITICRLFLDGYCNGLPSRAAVRFSHEDQKLSKPEISDPGIEEDDFLARGSKIVAQLLLDTNDERFSAYRVAPTQFSDSMSWAIERAKQYILACSDPKGTEADEEGCKHIGGRIHIATVKRESGFCDSDSKIAPPRW